MVPATLGSAVTAARGKNEHYLRTATKGDLLRAQEMQGMSNYTHIKQAVTFRGPH